LGTCCIGLSCRLRYGANRLIVTRLFDLQAVIFGLGDAA
jgi:hypothetical protein